jgi:hypothetical protein
MAALTVADTATDAELASVSDTSYTLWRSIVIPYFLSRRVRSAGALTAASASICRFVDLGHVSKAIRAGTQSTLRATGSPRRPGEWAHLLGLTCGNARDRLDASADMSPVLVAERWVVRRAPAGAQRSQSPVKTVRWSIPILESRKPA